MSRGTASHAAIPARAGSGGAASTAFPVSIPSEETVVHGNHIYNPLIFLDLFFNIAETSP